MLVQNVFNLVCMTRNSACLTIFENNNTEHIWHLEFKINYHPQQYHSWPVHIINLTS